MFWLYFSIFIFSFCKGSFQGLEKRSCGSSLEKTMSFTQDAHRSSSPEPEIQKSALNPPPELSVKVIPRSIQGNFYHFRPLPPTSNRAERTYKYLEEDDNYQVLSNVYDEEIVDVVPVTDVGFSFIDVVINAKKFQFTQKNIELALAAIQSHKIKDRNLMFEHLQRIPLAISFEFEFLWPFIDSPPTGFGNVLITDAKTDKVIGRTNAVQLNYNRNIEFNALRYLSASEIMIEIYPGPTHDPESTPIVSSIVDVKQIALKIYSVEIILQLEWFVSKSKQLEQEGFTIL